AQGSEADMAQRMGARHIEGEVASEGERALAVVRAFAGVSGAVLARLEAGVTTLRVDAPSELRPAIVRAVVEGGLDLLRIDRLGGQLESIFLRLTQGQSKDLA